jgi:hypothetical protein
VKQSRLPILDVGKTGTANFRFTPSEVERGKRLATQKAVVLQTWEATAKLALGNRKIHKA